MKKWPIPLVLGVLAIIAGNVSFILSVNEGFVETCFLILRAALRSAKQEDRAYHS